ncbi:MAG: RnfABCDGE type electron transport complex subunit B [Candidatus Aminicenantes bacterium]|nr:RnfABCDGE type electron transport complex subunit B [Candidatus Aminicenantes bacterium]
MNPLILYPVFILGIVAAGAAVTLFLVAKKFKVDEDPRIDEVLDLLPGANCGGCGYPGCRGFSEALVDAADNGDLAGFMCPPGGSDTMSEVGRYLGLDVDEAEPTAAVVRCGGSRQKAPQQLHYDGPAKCAISHALFRGANGCPLGCVGLGDCVDVCDFDAIHINRETGLPEVETEKCVSCGACVEVCPREIIEIRPRGRKDRRVWVCCVNKEKGAVVRKNCKAACIGCGKCEKVCPEKAGAIRVENFLAYIDPEKCIACGLCIPECPTGAILATFQPPKKKSRAAPGKTAAEKVAGKKVETAKEEVKQ